MVKRTLVAGWVILLTAASVAESQTPAELLQSALYQQEVRGDVPAALKLYHRILAGSAGDRPTMARALVQMALGYETLGSDSAVAAYRRVLAEFSDQREPADRARQRLAILAPPSAGTASPPSGIVARQLWSTRAGLGVNALSPDGRRVAFVDWSTVSLPGLRGNADLAFYDLVTRRAGLVTDRPSQALVDTYISGAIWSPDGQRLAYSLWDSTWTHQDLWLIDTDGRSNTLLVNNEQFANLDPMEWSAAGGFIAARVLGWDERYRIVLISPRDGTTRVVKTLDAHAPHAISVSPDGRFLLYDYLGDGSQNHDLFLLAADGSSEVRLAAHAADEPNGFFAPDGGRVVFVSGRSGQAGLWSVPVAEGKATGEPELVRPDLGAAQLLGFSRSGALTYVVPRSESDVSWGAVSLDGAASFGTLTPLAESFVGRNWRAVWSPEGSRIAYLSNRGTGTSAPHLVVASASGVEERSHRLPFRIFTRATRPSWSADGKAVLLEGAAAGDPAPSDFRRVTWRVDLETGAAAAEPYLNHAAGVASGIFRYATARQTKRLAELKLRLFGQSDLQRHSTGDLMVAPGEDALLVRNGVHRSPGTDASAGRWLVRGHMHAWELSPDGNTLAMALPSDSTRDMSNVLYVMPVTGGPLRELARVAADQEIGTVRWLPDGRTLVYGVIRAEHEPGQLWRVDVDAGPARRIDLGIGWRQLAELDFDAEGKRVAVTSMKTLRELWIMEGFPWQRRATP